MSGFDTAFERVIGHEGGFTDNPKDRGNWSTGIIGKGTLKGTKYGIAAFAYPSLDIKNLTIEQAKDIYKRDYWDRVRGDEFPFPIAFQLFDAAVNHGPSTAIKFLQRALGLTDDAIIGPKTLAAARSFNQYTLCALFNDQRKSYYMLLSSFPTFGKGWLARVRQNMVYAAQDTKP